MGCIQSCLKGKQEDVAVASEEVPDSTMGQVASRVQEYWHPQNDTEGTKPLIISSTESIGQSAPSVNSIHSTDSGSFPLGTQTATPRRPLSSVRNLTPVEGSEAPLLEKLVAYKRSLEFIEADEANQTEAHIPIKKAREHLLYLDYPFLDDTTTIEYIKKSKIMFIMKGISGSGKSTVSSTIRDTFPHTYHSADEFFNKTGEYIFEFEKLKEAHQSCQLGAIEASEKHQNIIIIDNTNVRNWEMKIYLDLAKEYNYIVIVVEPKTPWCKDAEELAKKNSHGVNEDIIRKKVKMYQDPCPLYYGWFLNEKDSINLIDLSHSWLKTALEESPFFFTDFSAQSGLSTKEEMLNYFTRQSIMNGNIMSHCTAMYTARGSQPNAKEYMRDPKVVHSLGKYVELNIIGFVITPRTIGARIQLSGDQLELWGQNDEEETPVYQRVYPVQEQIQENTEVEIIENLQVDDTSKTNSDEDISKNMINNQDTKTKESTNDVEPSKEKIHNTQDKGVEGKSNKGGKGKKGNGGGGGGDKGNKQKNSNNNTEEITIPQYSEEKREFDCLSTIEQIDQDLGVNRFAPSSGKGSRAHITIGCANKVRPVTTGLDLIDAVNAEQEYHSQSQLNETSLNKDSDDVSMIEPSENGGGSFIESFNISGAVLRQYWNGTWVVYPEKKCIIGSIFTGSY